jgi:CRISPR-associated endonuclease/helicase Cas3
MLGGHHGVFGQAVKKKELAQASLYQPGLGEDGWAQERRTHFGELRRVTGAYSMPAKGLPAELAVVVSGLVVIADWLASQTDVIERHLLPIDGWRGRPEELDDHWRKSVGVAGSALRKARLGRARFTVCEFSGTFDFPPNALQRDLIDALPELVDQRGAGLVLVTAPTGDGKTEAALFAAGVLGRASDARGLYFALPTMATANGMHPRVKEFADKALSGERALVLLHSMARLSPLFNPPHQDSNGEDPPPAIGELSSDLGTALEAGDWLLGRNRGLLAPLGVGTIDQALLGVLPLKHNALRLFGLSDKVFVVDEAHAYGPWMHQLLVRLLEWLGAFKAPVVLLSATLTGRTAASLVNAYRRGAGFPEPTAIEPRYPGWLFADAATGSVGESRATASERPRRLDVVVRSVAWDVNDSPEAGVQEGGRRAALRQELENVAREGGTALVCCTTVAEAQSTYRDLCATFPELAAVEGGIRLLHSRYQACVRQRITDECEAAYGKPRLSDGALRPRPASILVATQVVEQSLDLDFDLIISDLAPLAQLLQRAGRCRRHPRGVTGRPTWAQDEERPRLVVLDPLRDRNSARAPYSWGTVYDNGLLHRTAQLLRHLPHSQIAVPGDVQELVDAVYAEDFVDLLDEAARREVRRMDNERLAEEQAEKHMAGMVAACGPRDVGSDLYRLSRPDFGITEEMITTRLGADSARVLCAFEQDDGRLTLDDSGEVPFPDPDQRLSRAELNVVMAHVAPVPRKWIARQADSLRVPAAWEKQALVRDLAVVRMRSSERKAWCSLSGDPVITASEVGLGSRPV